MPINTSALSSPEPDDRTPDEIAGKVAHDDLAEERQDASDYVAESQQREQQEEPAKRKRRTKAELIAEAVVPADNAATTLKDVGTGAKIERTWLEAVALVKDGKAEFADKGMKHALAKYEQQQAAPAFAQEAASAVSEPLTEQSLADAVKAMSPPATDVSGQPLAPEGAEVGDEVIVGADTYYVGHGNVLVDGLVADHGEIITPRRRWQRVLGAGSDGPWESQVLVGLDVYSAIEEPSVPIEQAEEKLAVEQSRNGKAEFDVQAELLPQTMKPVPGTNQILIGAGLLEKIGLPQVEQFAGGSQLQVGPFTMSRLVVDDGRREKVTFADGREGEIISAAAEGFELLDNTVEFIAARFRGQLQSFLAVVGVIKQPVA